MFKLTPTQIAPAVFGLLLTVATAAFASTPTSLEPGAKIRATVVDTTGGKVKSRKVSGTLVSLDAATVTLNNSQDRSLMEIPRENITNLETRVQQSKKSTGALIGLGVGAGLGALIGFASGDDPDGIVSFSAGAKAGMGAITLGALGAIVGAVASPGDHWQEIPEDKVQLGFGLSPAGEAGIFLTRRF